MAVWTFDFYIVQKNHANLKQGKAFDEILSWSGENISQSSLTALSRHFTATKGWSAEILQYGSSDSTNIQICYDQKLLQEISCSLDIRNITIPQIEAILEFMQNNEAVIFYEDNFYEASKKNLKHLIQNSMAFKFCQNPATYFDSLEKQ